MSSALRSLTVSAVLSQTSPRMTLFYAITLLGLMIAPTTTLLHQTTRYLETTETRHPNIALLHHPSIRTPTIPRLSPPSAVLTSLSILILPDILYPVHCHSHLRTRRVNATNPCQRNPPRFDHNGVTIDFPCSRNWVIEGRQHRASILDQPPYLTKWPRMKQPHHNMTPLSVDSMP